MKAKDFVGGRGKKVSYQTEMFRIPTPLRPTVQQIGFQFRLLWDGISDPRGENLISRIQSAIPDVEQVSHSSNDNQISSKEEAVAASEELAKVRSQLDTQSAEVVEWQEKAKEAERLAEERLAEIERLRNATQPAASPDVDESGSQWVKLVEKINGNEKGYKPNDCTQALRGLRDILKPTKYPITRRFKGDPS